MALSFHTTLKSPTPVFKKRAWSKIAKKVLGNNFDLSVVLIGNHRSRRLNRIYRAKDKPTNVLAFPISKTAGEIYITIPYAIREAPHYGHSQAKHMSYLFVHGLLHLKGLDHGKKMETLEAKLLKRFKK